MKLNVLVACESSGAVREAFRRLGANAWSCDLLPADDDSPYHLQMDVREAIDHFGAGFWHIMVAHPPCTYLAISGIHWNNRIEGRAAKTTEALAFVEWLMSVDIPFIALENPVGVISTHIRKADQYIQPYHFGHPESKKTGIWLKGLPPLMATQVLAPVAMQANGKSPRWENQTPNGQNKLAPSPDRWKLRSATYQGIADAMAAQWLPYVTALVSA